MAIPVRCRSRHLSAANIPEIGLLQFLACDRDSLHCEISVNQFLSHDVRVVAAVGVMSKNDRATQHDHANHLEDSSATQGCSFHEDLLNAAIGQRNALSPSEDVMWEGNALVRPERFQ
ncbi:hypothetical protein TBK1r_26880 [Stieleria magnilauensis]|uniref:Uncharacterized protein n=1 Tax=Stieleria magnilauensis TaxID=2527963 RepID=A0ABX5XSY4_9BACT|nr:hypothetical protein TBK1r_26880 [Planctomycetes bacterium TBK1r]